MTRIGPVVRAFGLASALALAGAAQAIPVTAGLVAYWSGDNTAADGSGNGHNGTLVGGAGYGAGLIGAAFDFTGNPGYVEVPDSAQFGTVTTSGNWAISLYANLRSGFDPGPPHNIGINSVFVGQDDASSHWELALTAVGASNNEIRFLWTAAGTNPTPYPTVTGEWHHILFENIGGFGYQIFVDGVAGPSSNLGAPITDVAAPLRIGNLDGFQVDGLLDEIAIYDRRLTADEIALLAQAVQAQGSVPAPSALALLLAGCAALGLMRRRRLSNG